MKTIKQQNKENEKTEVHFSIFKEEVRWMPFNDCILSSRVEAIESGRGGELLKKSAQQFPGLYLVVQCAKTKLKGKLYWKHAVKNIIDRIEWGDGVIKKY